MSSIHPEPVSQETIVASQPIRLAPPKRNFGTFKSFSCRFLFPDSTTAHRKPAKAKLLAPEVTVTVISSAPSIAKVGIWVDSL